MSALRRRLAELYKLVEKPTKAALRDAAGHAQVDVSASTLYDLTKVGVKSSPKWPSVEAFVEVCREHASRELGTRLSSEWIDLNRWRRLWDEDQAENRVPTRQPPQRVGVVPSSADDFQERQLGIDIDGISDGATLVLTDSGTRLLSGMGGVGKTQLAIHIAERLYAAGDVDLLVWVTATSQGAIRDAYADAAIALGLRGADRTDADRDAARFHAWLHTPDRRWIVVLDDLLSTADLHPLRPPSRPGGRTLITTRIREPALDRADCQLVPVGVYRAVEAVDYLTRRLAKRPALADDVEGVAADLGNLPLALAHAAAFMIEADGTTCTDYRRLFADRRRHLDLLAPPPGSRPDGYDDTVATTVSLAADRADEDPRSRGLIWPILELASVLDPTAQPVDVFYTDAARNWFTYHRTTDTDEGDELVDDHTIRAGLRALHRLHLITIDTTMIMIHALVQRTIRDTFTGDDLADTTWAAADALQLIWPDNDHHPARSHALRANTTIVASHAGDSLWTPECHPVVYRVGVSFLNAGLTGDAVAYWRTATATALRLLGDEHPYTLIVSTNLASSYWQAGRTADAIVLLEKVVADSARVRGDEHPDTLAASTNLASSYHQAGRTADAIAIEEKVIGAFSRVRGDEHPDTLIARGNLADSYQQSGRVADAIVLLEKVVADSARVRGDEHPGTLTARTNLASSYWRAGRIADAIVLLEKVVADSARVRGDEHPDTLAARDSLASSYGKAGRIADAIVLLEKVVADSARVRGDEHPGTLAARGSLASSYRRTGRTADAIVLLEAVVEALVRVCGDEHPDTLAARGNLASSYGQAGRTADAIALEEKVVAASARVCGDEHPNTLATRSNLASSYGQAGRIADAVVLLEAVVEALARVCGDEHPNTLATRSNLASSYLQAGRTADAIVLLEKVVAASARVCGDEHPGTLATRSNLASSYWQAGRTADAIALEEKVVAASARVCGDEHPDTLAARDSLASSYGEVGRTADAIVLLEKVVADSTRVCGDEHPNTLAARGNLANSYRQAGRTADAIVLLEKVVAAFARVRGDEHPENVAAATSLTVWREQLMDEPTASPPPAISEVKFSG